MAFEKNPKEIFVTFTKEKVFSCEASFVPSRWNNGEGEPPLKVVDSTFSGFRFTIIDKIGDSKKPATARIDCDINYFPFIGKIEKALDSVVDSFVTEEEEKNSPDIPKTLAYSQTLAMKPFAGMTPAEVLSDPKNEEELVTIYGYLEKNVDRYPKNKAQMSAINEALDLFRSGKLVKAEVKKEKNQKLVFSLTKAIPYVKDPGSTSSRRAQEGEIVPCVEVYLYLWPANRSPFQLEIINYDSPLRILENGTSAGTPSKMLKDTYVKNSIFLSWEIMKNLVERMKHSYDGFFYSQFPEALKLANNILQQKHLNSKKDAAYPEQ